jgi:hypothetical protein
MLLSEHLQFHINNRICVAESVFRPGSESHVSLLTEARSLYLEGNLTLDRATALLFEATDLGLTGLYEGEIVPLDMPLEILDEAEYHGKKVKLGYPMRGGSKKFYVYVRKPGGGVKKVSFGDTTGLRAKLNNPAARRAFAARHDCKNKKDRTKASYWSCRLPRYAKLLGFKTTFSGYW